MMSDKSIPGFCSQARRLVPAAAFLLMLGLAAPVRAQDAPAVAPLPADANTTCPLMPEEPVDPELYVDYKGRRIYLCCTMCRRNFAKNPEKYLNMLPPGGTAAPAEDTTSTEALSAQEQPTTSSAAPGTAQPQAGFIAPAAALPQGGSRPAALPQADEAAPPPAVLERLARYTGRLHAVSVHFPIGLLLGAAAVEAVAVMRRRPVGSEGARLTLGLGTAGAVVAVPLGWLNAAFTPHPGLEHYLEWHRWLGTAAGGAAVAAWLLARGARTGNRTLEKAYLTTLFAGSILLIVAGHFGASLIYGPDYLVP